MNIHDSYYIFSVDVPGEYQSVHNRAEASDILTSRSIPFKTGIHRQGKSSNFVFRVGWDYGEEVRSLLVDFGKDFYIHVDVNQSAFVFDLDGKFLKDLGTIRISTSPIGNHIEIEGKYLNFERRS